MFGVNGADKTTRSALDLCTCTPMALDNGICSCRNRSSSRRFIDKFTSRACGYTRVGKTGMWSVLDRVYITPSNKFVARWFRSEISGFVRGVIHCSPNHTFELFQQMFK